MKKNKLFDTFALVMIGGIVLITLLDALLINRGPITVIKAVTIVAAILGVTNCVLSSNASIWNYLFGLPAVVFQGIVALNEGNYGIGTMDLVILVPMQVVGFFVWTRRGAALSSDTQQAQVQARRLTWQQGVLVGLIAVVCTFGLGLVLRHYGANSPWLDGGAVVLQIIAQILMTLAFMEQWVIWILVNSVYIGIWVHTYILSFTNPDISANNAALMIAMWVFYLIIAIHGLRVWMNISRLEK